MTKENIGFELNLAGFFYFVSQVMANSSKQWFIHIHICVLPYTYTKLSVTNNIE